MNNEKEKFKVSSFEEYKNSSLRLLKERLIDFYGEERFLELTIDDIKKDVKDINAYKNIDKIKEVEDNQITIFNDSINTDIAKENIMEGRILWEHACAGEATRLGIGTKYLIKPNDIDYDRIRKIMITELEKNNESQDKISKVKQITNDELFNQIGINPKELLPLSLGIRHMVQLLFDIKKIAIESNRDYNEVIKKQKMLMILNEQTSDIISKEVAKYNFFGLDERNFLFMEQKSFHGINLEKGELYYNEIDSETKKEKDNKRLHNHGQMIMQKLCEKSIFRIISGKKEYLKVNDYLEMLKTCNDLISYNIEDLGYLTSSINLQSLANALNLGKKGYEMVMEVVLQNPIKPQKGASLFYDPEIDKNVMIESFRLGNMKNEDLKFMNKNFNHYPNPHQSALKLKEFGLPLGFDIKTATDSKDYIYPCPVQGDLNFIVKTAFVRKEKLEPISGWKTGSQTPNALKEMYNQEKQEGFIEFLKELELI